MHNHKALYSPEEDEKTKLCLKKRLVVYLNVCYNHENDSKAGENMNDE